jgi:tetratricopeptide (TPR) repeat protein
LALPTTDAPQPDPRHVDNAPTRTQARRAHAKAIPPERLDRAAPLAPARASYRAGKGGESRGQILTDLDSVHPGFSMAKVGRNDPCPCGSARKYKKCCLPSQSLPAPARASSDTTALEIADLADLIDDVEDLDELSNAVVDQIQAGRLDEAERLCQQLAERYPDLIDPLERYGMLYEARGDYATAADYYRRAADYARTNEGFDPAISALWLASAERVEAMAHTLPHRAATQSPTPARDDAKSDPDSQKPH